MDMNLDTYTLHTAGTEIREGTISVHLFNDLLDSFVVDYESLDKGRVWRQQIPKNWACE
jgi:hypothetical protein